MKIFSILCVKNEADIIEECLRRSSVWCDRIFVYDGASTDGTWEKVQAMANDRIVAARCDDKVWDDSLRAEIFEQFRHEARDGDWWCRLDADEFYIDEPRDFLAARAPLHHSVWGLKFEYYLTDEELALMPEGRAPAGESPVDYLRHRARLHWGLKASAPTHVGLTSPGLIRFRHLPYRSPEQISRRLKQRLKSVADGHVNAGGWDAIVDDWEKMGYRNASDLYLDAGDGNYQYDPAKIADYKGSAKKRAIQWLCHASGYWP
jgi:hypothetical protein